MRQLTFILALLAASLNGYSQNSEDPYLIARAHMLHEQFDSALIFFNSGIAARPNDFNAVYYRGITNFELGRYNDAIADFLLVNRRYTGKAGFYLAKCESRLNHPDLAIKYLKENLKSSFKVAEKTILLDEDMQRLESTSAWRALWNEKEWYNHYDKLFQEVEYLISSGQQLESLNILSELESKGYKRSIVLLRQAEIYAENGNPKAALDAASKSVKADFRNQEALKLRIKLLIEDEAYTEALDDCERILRNDPAEFSYYLISAQLMGRTGSYDRAVESIEAYIDLFPKQAVAYHELGLIHQNAGKYIPALTALNKALELDKGNPLIFLHRGQVYASTGMHRYAERDFGMSLDLDPMNSETWYEKGLSDYKLGNTDDACFDFKKALQYGNFKAREYIDRYCR